MPFWLTRDNKASIIMVPIRSGSETMSKIFKTAATIVILVFLAALVVAATNLQAQPKPTGVTTSNTAEGHVLVSWDDDAAPVHRVGWTHDAEFRAAQAAGDWLEAFHFADTKRETDYAIKYLPGGQPYWIIVGAANERFGGATWSDWTSLTTAASANSDPDPPVPGQGAAADCTADDYDRAEWGEYPAPDPQAIPTWTKPADDVASRDITLDHHVALKDAHISGGCDWSATMKNDFATDPENLNPTTRSFNSSKGSRTPDQLTGIALSIIDTGGEKCDYATQHDEVKDKYDLTVTADEAATVTEWLSLCTTNTSTTSTPSETATGDGASQSSPVPYGQIAEVGDFDVSILSVDPDAWPEVVAENGFNDAPQQGNRMIMFNLHVTNSRGDEAEFFGNSYLSLLGSRSMPYTTFGEQSRCGVIPSELGSDVYDRFGTVSIPSGETSVGNVCFQVPEDEDMFLLKYESFDQGVTWMQAVDSYPLPDTVPPDIEWVCKCQSTTVSGDCDRRHNPLYICFWEVQ